MAEYTDILLDLAECGGKIKALSEIKKIVKESDDSEELSRRLAEYQDEIKRDLVHLTTLFNMYPGPSEETENAIDD